MSETIFLSDEEDLRDFSTPLPSKKPRTSTDSLPNLNPPHSVIAIDDDPTPQKLVPTSTVFVIPDTPTSDITIIKCTRVPSDPETRASNFDKKFSGLKEMVSLESDNESEGGPAIGRKNSKENETADGGLNVEGSDWSSRFIEPAYSLGRTHFTQTSEVREFRLENENTSREFGAVDKDWSSRFIEPICSPGHVALTQMSEDGFLHSTSWHNETAEELDNTREQDVRMDDTNKVAQQKNTRANANKRNYTSDALGRSKMSKEENKRLMEEKKIKKLQEKLHKQALKAEAAELKKMEKEKKKWENGKLALKCIVAEIDARVIELGSVGGNLLTRFAEKGITYRITSNPIERSILWTMNVPENISQLSPKGVDISYILLVYEAEEFCNLVSNESLVDHVLSIQSRYPSHTVCYLTNRLMSHMNKREQHQYKNPSNSSAWRRPPVEEVLAKLTTHFAKVHSRQCVDEAEVAEHVVGLTCSLASCQFRKKLTRLSINANGSLIPKDSIDRTLIQKSFWLKSLVAIPKVQPRFAIAIWKKYPTMKSLLSVYMDPRKSVHDKEFLLKDLTVEGLVGEERRLGEVCSKRVYRILMAQNGCIKTDDVEEGADFFRCESSCMI